MRVVVHEHGVSFLISLGEDERFFLQLESVIVDPVVVVVIRN